MNLEGGAGTFEKPLAFPQNTQKIQPDLMMLDDMGQDLSIDFPVEIGILRGSRDSNDSSLADNKQPSQLNEPQPRISCDAPNPGPQLQAMYDLSSLTAGRMGHIFSPDQAIRGPGDLCSEVAQCRCSTIKNFTSQLLSQCSKLPLQPAANQNLRDADIAIRAVLHGWHAVTRKYLLDPLWSMLRHADEVWYSDTNVFLYEQEQRPMLKSMDARARDLPMMNLVSLCTRMLTSL